MPKLASIALGGSLSSGDSPFSSIVDEFVPHFPPTYRYKRGTRESYEHIKIKRAAGVSQNVNCMLLILQQYRTG